MVIKNILYGYDSGGIDERTDDGYMNLEVEYSDEYGEKLFVWVSRSMDYETIMVSQESMYDTGMRMTHFYSDFDTEYQYLLAHAIETYEYETGSDAKEQAAHSLYIKEILFALKSLDMDIHVQKDFFEEAKEKDVSFFCV